MSMRELGRIPSTIENISGFLPVTSAIRRTPRLPLKLLMETSAIAAAEISVRYSILKTWRYALPFFGLGLNKSYVCRTVIWHICLRNNLWMT